MDFTVILSVLLELGLSSAVGFRIFVPALVTSVASHLGYINLAEGMQWMASYPAMVNFGVATLLEIFGYYIPFVDNILDTVAAPAAVICGTLLMGSTILEMDPLIKWPISVIAGGGLATTILGGTSLIRAKSSGFTAGLGNAIISTIEGIVSGIISITSIVLPVLSVVIILWILYIILRPSRLE